MKTMVTAALATLWLALGQPNTVAAQESPVIAQDEQHVVPFVPSLDKPIRYSVTSWKVNDGEEKDLTRVDQSLIYKQVDGSLLLTITTDMFWTGGQRIEPSQMGPFATLMSGVPFEVDQSGTLVRVKDWAQFNDTLEKSIPLIAASAERDPAKREEAEAFFSRFFARYRAMSPEEAVGHAIKHWPEVLGLGGIHYETGLEYEEASEAFSPLADSPMQQQSRYSFQHVGDNILRFSNVTTTSAEDLVRVIGNLTEEVGGKRPTPDATAEILEAGAMMVIIEVDMLIDTGMIERATIEKRFGTSGNFVVIERI